jgi:hypothetical protein
MEFHGIPWKMEFNEISWNSSMEFHGIMKLRLEL